MKGVATRVGLISWIKINSLDNLESARKLLLNEELRFSRIDRFNDPFDCVIGLNTDTFDENEKERFCRMSERVRSKDISFEEAFLLLENELNTPRIFNEELRDNVIAESQKFGISCFCENYDPVLMWSHYADSHQPKNLMMLKNLGPYRHFF